MRRRRLSLNDALDAWSDFAIDCWLYALRFAILLILVLPIRAITNDAAPGALGRLVDNAGFVGVLIFGMGILLAGAVRLERMLVSKKKERLAPANGGRTLSSRRPKLRQWGNRKRKRK